MMKLDERRARLRRKMMHRITREVRKHGTLRQVYDDTGLPEIVQDAITSVLFEDFLDELGDRVDANGEISSTT